MPEKNNAGRKRVLLISMPFAHLSPPSAQLAALDAYLTANGIETESRHLYLKGGDYLGLDTYGMILGQDSFYKDIFYSRLLFPDHFEKNRELLENVVQKGLEDLETSGSKLSVEELFDKFDQFNACILSDIDRYDFGFVGFSVNYSQLLPSLYVARAIKSRYPSIKIVFGGWSISGQKGVGVMRAFPAIDYVISGEGEEALADLVTAEDHAQRSSIPGLIYRSGGEVIYNDRTDFIKLDELPYFEFDSYFKELDSCSDDVRHYCEINFSIPIETSRGCWWNKCNFCSYSLVPNKYRVKSPARVRDELEVLSKKHSTTSLFFLDEAMTSKDVGKLFDALGEIEKELIVFSIGRAQRLSKDDIKKMYNAGVTAHQIGVESFSTNLLRKIEKGTTAIENIQIIKQLAEIGIYPSYTLLHSFPYQDRTDYIETKRNLSYLKHFPPPAGTFAFELQYGSSAFSKYSSYNIESYSEMNDHRLIYPGEIADKLISSVYNYNRINKDDLCLEEFKSTIEKFVEETNELRKSSLGKPLLFYKDGGDILVIQDHREEHVEKYILDDFERALYLFCDTIRTDQEIELEFAEHSWAKIKERLELFNDHKLLFSDRGEHLSLAFRHRFKVQ